MEGPGGIFGSFGDSLDPPMVKYRKSMFDFILDHFGAQDAVKHRLTSMHFFAHGLSKMVKDLSTYFDDVLERFNPLHVRARLNRIAASLALGLHDSAMDDCRILLEQAPDLTLAKCRMADVFMLVVRKLLITMSHR